MLTSCAWCATPFPANDSIEEMPVGRRLAFDASKGRLWAVCRRCERWNLAPIEQRWEAIESCERAFRETRLRASTDQVGLAKLRDGTELVRIGRPIPREFAAWRYGDQFGRRRGEGDRVRRGGGGGSGRAGGRGRRARSIGDGVPPRHPCGQPGERAAHLVGTHARASARRPGGRSSPPDRESTPGQRLRRGRGVGAGGAVHQPTHRR
jgi:hypothetical protein